jgi:hypothetical protein
MKYALLVCSQKKKTGQIAERGYDAYQANFILETILPTANGTGNPIKDQTISRSPNSPASSNHNFSKEASAEISSSL